MDSEDKKTNLFPVRCPFERLSRTDGKLYRCNSLCVRVQPKSGGEARCRKCRLSFMFTCDENGVVSTYVNAKPLQ
jgi:hypothetical protein